jgi:DNA-binding beta-propeller fold protein YncE
MKKLTTLALMMLTLGVFAQAPVPLGTPGPNIPRGKAPEQGYVPDGWAPHAGSLLKYSVEIRFGEEPETMPAGMKFGRVSAVTTDAQNNVYVFKRDAATDQIVVFDSQGKFLRSWGKGMFARPHGLRVDREENVWAVDDAGHQVFKFTREGKLLQTWGVKGVPGNDAKTFNRPTDIAWDSQGNAYISDGYGGTRVVKLDKAGNYVAAWGTPGDGPGQFRVPHSIAVDSKDRVYVSDRENNRIQIFDSGGKLLKTWTHLGCTQGMFITPKDEMWVVTHRNNSENITYDTLAGQLMRLDIESGRILGAMESPGHNLTASATGAIYVASLTGNVFKWQPNPWWPARAHEAQRAGIPPPTTSK